MGHVRSLHNIRIFGKVVKLSVSVLIFAVCSILLWRVFTSGDPKEVSRLMVNEHTKAAYDTHGENMKMRFQGQYSITLGETNRGYFAVTQSVFIPQADQVQIVFRYNNSTIKNLAKDYNLPEVPSKDSELFDVTLVRTNDATPENRSDNFDTSTLELTRYYPTDCIRHTTALYTYYRFIFDGVVLEDNTVGVFADVYYVEDIDYEKTPYGSLCLYDDQSPWMAYTLTKEDIAALQSYGKED